MDETGIIYNNDNAAQLYNICNRCTKNPCCCKNLDIINRRHNYLLKTFDMDRMEEYFGIESTDYVKKSISLKRTGRFSYFATIKKTNIYNPLHTYINGLPRDVNNVIYSYLWEPNFTIDIRMYLPPVYPFRRTKWTILNYVKDGKKMDNNKETQNVMCLLSDMSPSISLDKEIIAYLSTRDDF